MSEALEQLLRILDLEQTDADHFKGDSQDLGYRRLFGGQVLAQALVAGYRTVKDRFAHSLHAYFLRPGDPEETLTYEVDRIRDGRSFTTRRVVAKQKDKPIFNMSISFQIKEEGVEHQSPMPTVPGPDGLISELERARKVADKIPEKMRYKATCERPIEIRVVNPINYFSPKKREPTNYHWMKTIAKLPDDPIMHQCLLAYSSDFGLMGTSLNPHGISFLQKELQAASLDHTMWFHRDFKMDEWLLYAVESPNANGARGLNFGKFFNRDGKLVASTAQEGLIRMHASS
ncbi:MAG: acyl-CoA thioesterase II [Oligoflexales bacterium]|nr:acyl-CoA thioesterase II [Oligoflexales bacterium]